MCIATKYNHYKLHFPSTKGVPYVFKTDSQKILGYVPIIDKEELDHTFTACDR
jgi:hypothetical protein